MNAGRAIYQLSFQISPIILTGGLAQGIPGGMLPIVLLTQSIDFVAGIISSGSADLNPDDFLCQFEPLPGGSFIRQEVATYPFANQSVAANATVAQPLTISMQMLCPVRRAYGYATKLATMTALQAALSSHNAAGGTYSVATPMRFYDNCIMTQMVDTSQANGKQPQERFRLDFVQPLLSLNAAAQAQNSLMGKITAGVPILTNPPAWSAPSTVTGAPWSVAGPAAVPSLAGPAGGSISAPSFLGGVY